MEYTRIMIYRRRVNSMDTGIKLSQQYLWIAFPGESRIDEFTQARRGLVVSGLTPTIAVENLERAIAERQRSGVGM